MLPTVNIAFPDHLCPVFPYSLILACTRARVSAIVAALTAAMLCSLPPPASPVSPVAVSSNPRLPPRFLAAPSRLTVLPLSASPALPLLPHAPSLSRPAPPVTAAAPPCGRGRLTRARGGPAARRKAAVARAHVAGGGSGGGDEGEGMAVAGSADLCVFPLSGVCLPTHSGALNVFEPRMLQLMDVITYVAASPSSPPSVLPRFALLPSAWTTALAAAAARQGEGGLTGRGALTWGADLRGEEEGEGGSTWFGDAPVGCSCVVHSSHTAPDSSRLVAYEATHRIVPRAMRRAHPFLVLLCHPLHDHPPLPATAPAPAAQLYAGQVDAAEQHVWEQLKEVAWLSAVLARSTSSSSLESQHEQQQGAGGARNGTPPPSAAASLLPAAVLRFGPDAMTGTTRRANTTAQAAISTWRSMKGPLAMERSGGEGKTASRGGSAGGAAGAEGAWNDPYWVAREALSKARRQEAFSFAAADMVELEQQHRSLLLGMTCTLQRLLWVQAAIEPHLASLRAEMAHAYHHFHRRSVLITAAVVPGTLRGNCRQRTRRHHCDRPPGSWIWRLVRRRAAMTYFHFFNCAALSFAPHLIFYKATPLSEYGTWTASLKAALVFFAAMLLKMILWASLLPESDHDPALAAPSRLDARQEALRAVIGAGVDLAGMRYALVHVSHRNMAFEHKFQAVGLGWALAESVSKRLVPLWVGAGGMEFKWDFLLDALSSNIELVRPPAPLPAPLSTSLHAVSAQSLLVCA
ncbi:unnamed protein product [Closterium sp. Yama58-4]|nr:unnamed protein product [Closterium sp. Yama58-4]